MSTFTQEHETSTASSVIGDIAECASADLPEACVQEVVHGGPQAAGGIGEPVTATAAEPVPGVDVLAQTGVDPLLGLAGLAAMALGAVLLRVTRRAPAAAESR